MNNSFQPCAPAVPVKNSEFLRALFPDLRGQCAWICVFSGDPGKATRAQWAGFGLAVKDFATVDAIAPPRSHLNTFCTFSAFLGENGMFPGRRNSLFGGMHALMLDDLGAGPGAKLPLEEHIAKLRPSWILETSPGNHQVGYILDEVIRDRAKASAFIDSMIYQGLMAEDDPGMSGVARLGRLPMGWNGKSKYSADGFFHRLIHWEPNLRYAPQQIAAAFEIDWERDIENRLPRKSPLSKMVAGVLPTEQAWINLLARAVGRFEGPQDKGPGGTWYDCTCPWVHEHTGMIDNGSAYCAGSGGGFECHHGHCQKRGWREVRQWLLDHEDRAIAEGALNLAAQEAFGLELLEAPRAETFGDPIPVFQQARALIIQLQKESLPAEIDRVLIRIGEWAATGHLTRVELATLKKDLTDLTGLGKGDVTGALKEATAAGRRQQNLAGAQKALTARSDRERPGRTAPEIPLLSPGALPLRAGDSEAPALVSGNIDYLLRAAQVRVAYNEMRQRKEYGGSFRGWSLDWATSWLRDACTLNGLSGANEINLKRMTDKLAEECSYHPFERWLNTLTWDGVSRLGELFNTIRVAPDKEQLRDLILRRWLCSAVAAARHLYAEEPGLQPRGLVVFTGGQHSGKSTWFARLFRGLFPKSSQCFVGNAHYSGDKDSKMLNTRSLVVEWGELETTFSKAELGAIKAFINQDMDSLRKPFAPEVSDIPRRSVFCGTVNRPEFLRDSTGNSRFWTLPALTVNLDAQRQINMTQMWAEVDRLTMTATVEAEAQDSYERPWLMTRKEIEYIEGHNRGHRDKSDMEVWLHELFQWDHPKWKDSPVEQRLDVNPMRLGDVAAMVGISRRGYGHGLSELKSALRELTGQTDAIATTRVIAGQRIKGRFWGMPPLVNVPTDASEEIFSGASKASH